MGTPEAEIVIAARVNQIHLSSFCTLLAASSTTATNQLEDVVGTDFLHTVPKIYLRFQALKLIGNLF